MRRALLVAVAFAFALPAAPAAAEPPPCNPGSWTVMDTSTSGDLYATFAATATDVWAVGGPSVGGQALAIHYDGATWTEIPVPLPPGATRAVLRSVHGTSSTDVWAAGYSHDSNQVLSPLVVHWDGAIWEVVPTPEGVGQLKDVTAITSTDAWIVGQHLNVPSETYPGYDQEALAMHWDGDSWSIVPTPEPAGSFHATLWAVSASSSSNVWAVGDWVGPTDDDFGELLVRWDGDSWDVMHDSFRFWLGDIVTVSPNNVWAVGYKAVGAEEAEAAIRQWDGDTWKPIEISAKGLLYAVDGSSPGDIWMLGASDASGPEAGTVSFGQHWDGEELSVFPTERSQDYNVQFEGMSVAPSGDVFAVGMRSGSSQDGPHVQHLCPIVVDEVQPASIAAGRARTAAVISMVEIGDGVAWKFDRANHEKHRVRDRSGMGLFDSGLRRRGASFTWRVRGAGTYAWNDPVGHERGRIRVPLELGREEGARTMVRWASRKPPPGFVYDVQVKAPRKDGFQYWQRGVTSVKATFEWKRGGEFIFRARLRRTTNGSFSGWSPLASFMQY